MTSDTDWEISVENVLEYKKLYDTYESFIFNITFKNTHTHKLFTDKKKSALNYTIPIDLAGDDPIRSEVVCALTFTHC